MPDGPVDTIVVNASVGVSKLWPSWSPPDVTTTHWNYPRSVNALKCPAERENPVRPDGSRPMSDWFKLWAKLVAPPWPVETAPLPGRNVWCHGSGSQIALGVAWPDAPNPHPGLFWEKQARWLDICRTKVWYVDQVAKTNTLNKLSQQKMDFGTTMLEMRQTIGFTRDLAVGILKGITTVVNSRQKFAHETDKILRQVAKGTSFEDAAIRYGLQNTDALKHARDGWMGYQFGLKPLVYDVHDSFDVLYQSLYQEQRALLLTVKSGFSEEWDEVQDLDCFGLYGVRIRAREHFTTMVNYALTYELPAGGVPIETLLGLDNGYSTAWEAAKLSWMVDYVVGFGKLFRSFTAANGLIFREGCKSVLLRRLLTDIVDIIPQDGARFVRKPDPRLFYRDVGQFTREVLTQGVVPGVVPQLKTGIGAIQLANSIFALTHWADGNSAVR